MLHLFCKGYPNRIRPKQPIPFLSTLLECLTIFSSTINLRPIEYRPMSSECGRGILARAAEKIGMNSMGRRLMAQNYECTPTRSHVDRKQGACLTISCTLWSGGVVVDLLLPHSSSHLSWLLGLSVPKQACWSWLSRSLLQPTTFDLLRGPCFLKRMTQVVRTQRHLQTRVTLSSSLGKGKHHSEFA